MKDLLYRVSFETINPHLALDFEAGRVTMAELVESDWRTVQRETTDPWDQYNTLKKWAETCEQPIRNVKLEQAEDAPRVWEEVKS